MYKYNTHTHTHTHTHNTKTAGQRKQTSGLLGQLGVFAEDDEKFAYVVHALGPQTVFPR